MTEQALSDFPTTAELDEGGNDWSTSSRQAGCAEVDDSTLPRIYPVLLACHPPPEAAA